MSSSASVSSSGERECRHVARPIIPLALLAMVLSGTAARAQQAQVGGFVQLDRRVSLADSVRLADFYNVFRPEFGASFEGRAEVVVSVDMRFHDFTNVRSTDDLDSADSHFPNSVTAWEAFARVSGFVIEPLDVTVGKQRIQWGAADGLNPTDRFNAYDLSDLTDFTARIPTWAVRAEYYASDVWWLEAVWTPTAHGPLLPPGMDDLLAGAGGAAPPVPVASWEQHFRPPSRRLGNGQYGLKLAGNVAGTDVSLSYFDGFDGIPAVDRLLFVTPDTASSSPTFDVHAWSALPRQRVIGGDMASEWRGIGLWGEGAVVFPEEIVLLTDLVTQSDSTRERMVALDDRPYPTWTVGGEYTFPGGWYVDLQWAHGLFLERGADQLHDYLVSRFERRLSRETVTLTLDAALEVAQWSDWSDQLGIGILPAVVYAPRDNVDFSLGAFIVAGSGSTLFGRWQDADQAYLRVKASF